MLLRCESFHPFPRVPRWHVKKTYTLPPRGAATRKNQYILLARAAGTSTNVHILLCRNAGTRTSARILLPRRAGTCKSAYILLPGPPAQRISKGLRLAPRGRCRREKIHTKPACRNTINMHMKIHVTMYTSCFPGTPAHIRCILLALQAQIACTSVPGTPARKNTYILLPRRAGTCNMHASCSPGTPGTVKMHAEPLCRNTIKKLMIIHLRMHKSCCPGARHTPKNEYFLLSSREFNSLLSPGSAEHVEISTSCCPVALAHVKMHAHCSPGAWHRYKTIHPAPQARWHTQTWMHPAPQARHHA